MHVGRESSPQKEHFSRHGRAAMDEPHAAFIEVEFRAGIDNLDLVQSAHKDPPKLADLRVPVAELFVQ